MAKSKGGSGFRYSEYPMAHYRLAGMEMDEIRIIEELPDATRASTWNLFWLSFPGLDVLPTAGPQWYKCYKPMPGLLASVCRDIALDEPLNRKLSMHPTVFLDYFAGADYQSFRTYDVAGRSAWVETVMSRASNAVDGLLKATPYMRVVDGRLKFVE